MGCTIVDQLSAIVAETEMPGVLCVSLSRTGSHKSHRTDKTNQHVGNTDRCKYNEKIQIQSKTNTRPLYYEGTSRNMNSLLDKQIQQTLSNPA